MDHLRIRLFGGLEVHTGQTLLPSFATEKSKNLFAFLVLNRDRLFHRHVLCGHFWGDQPDADARKALRTALWRIRSVLEPNQALRGTFLRVEGQHVGFPGTGDAWVDASEFAAGVGAPGRGGWGALSEDDARRLVDAVSLYRGDLLEGTYDDWCLIARERLRMTFLTALERLMTYYREREEWLEAIDCGRQLLREDPLREHVHRAIMECHVSMGNRPSALRQYGTCVRILREELDIRPMEETVRLYESVRAFEPMEDDPTSSNGETGKPESPAWLLAAEVEQALNAVYALTERLEEARSALEYQGNQP